MPKPHSGCRSAPPVSWARWRRSSIGSPLWTWVATTMKEEDYAGCCDLSRGAGGQSRQVGVDRKAIARSACRSCPHPRRSLRRVPFRFRDGRGDIADRVAAGARPRSGRPDRRNRRRRPRLEAGQRVGVGFLGGSCGYCVYCRDGDLVNCTNQGYTGVQHDGGYAEMMIAKSSGLIAVPDDLSSVDAAPLLCAGLTTFSALRNSPARAGDLVAVFGVGGLGHLGVQYARRMGFEVVAIDRGADRAELSKKLGAHHYIDSATTDVAKALQQRGGAQMVLATASGGKAVAAALGGLRRGGVVISLGATDEPIELSAFELLFKQLGVDGALTGTPKAGEATLRFSAMSDVAAMVETMPLERAPEPYARMMSGQARFRMVLTIA